jgi:hypothetical protein
VLLWLRFQPPAQKNQGEITMSTSIKLITILGLVACLAPQVRGQKASDFVLPPKVAESAEGVFQSSSSPTLLVGRSLLKNDSPLSDAVARLGKQLGSTSAPTLVGKTLPQTSFVLVGLVSEHDAFKKLAEEWKPKLPKEG